MKVDLDFGARAYMANLLRRRSMELDDRSQQSVRDSQRVELVAEARYVENLSIQIDNGEDLVLEEKRTPITAVPDRDINYLNGSSGT